MGVRYYAYAFDSDQTEEAMADPISMISEDPLADAWGMEPGFTIGVLGERTVSKRNMLYLDKAWPYLQRLTGAPEGGVNDPRISHLMFAGEAAGNSRHWMAQTGIVVPSQVALVARDLEAIEEEEVARSVMQRCGPGDRNKGEVEYVLQYFRESREFAAGVAEDGRGFAFMIG